MWALIMPGILMGADGQRETGQTKTRRGWGTAATGPGAPAPPAFRKRQERPSPETAEGAALLTPWLGRPDPERRDLSVPVCGALSSSPRTLTALGHQGPCRHLPSRCGMGWSHSHSGHWARGPSTGAGWGPCGLLGSQETLLPGNTAQDAMHPGVSCQIHSPTSGHKQAGPQSRSTLAEDSVTGQPRGPETQASFITQPHRERPELGHARAQEALERLLRDGEKVGL